MKLIIILVFCESNILVGLEHNTESGFLFESSKSSFIFLKQNYVSLYSKYSNIYYSNIYSNSEKSASSSFLFNVINVIVYTTEFLFSLVWPTLFNGALAMASLYNPGQSFDIFPEGLLLYIGVNSILVPLTIHGIGVLCEKKGNLKNSIIATAISSIPGAISYYLLWKYPELSLAEGFFLGCLSEFSPSLGGVIGYNVKISIGGK
ncbi:MAG: hypothetical protein ABIN73_07440 [candidate division WOR-3 bacterium]